MKSTTSVLKNKLRVLATPLPSVSSVTAMILVGAGSRYEQRQENGIAHFLEHMFFKGTKKRPNALEISSVIDGIGGEFNAFTSKEYTGFYIKASAKHLDLVLDVLTDMLLNSKLDSGEIERERGVIFEELRMYLDTPMRYVGDVFENLLYGDQPLGWNIIGSLQSLKNIKRGDLTSYLSRFYVPNNLIVSISGGVGADEAESLVEKHLGGEAAKKTTNFLPVEITQKRPAVKLVSKKTEQAHFCLGVRSYPRGHENRYKLAVLNTIIGVSMSSRLFIQLRERRGLAYYVRSGVDEYRDTGFFAAQAGVEIKKIDEAIKVTLAEFAKLAKEKVSSKELTKAKEYIKGKLVLELEDSREVASLFGIQALLEEKIKTPQEIMKEIDKVEAADIQKVASDIFRDSALNLAIIGPYKDKAKFAKILKL
ncbi:MAG: Peptidase M16 domain protein [Candidatus Woesebacteria bacterium GW2011_GWA1_45_8]|uniref:Peptidase M16 domain protein n=1 Tax=Candidatus Woesebacteria bacterium GW2011_GWA1_45_8 TaxID=1618559 RepID=A0A0G1MVF8_9BACT|nr:MAG: Peptidase M16 domain protein [Candidatus Woesebacteria bacterium GW2011_GWA1_45_8]